MTTLLSVLCLALASLADSLALPTTAVAPEPYNPAAARLLRRAAGGVTLATGKNFTGQTWSGVYPDEECINLNGFAGHTLSFRPDAGTECFVMQGRCDASTGYADMYNDSDDVGDLSGYPWIARVQSYTCFEAVELARSRVLMKFEKAMA